MHVKILLATFLVAQINGQAHFIKFHQSFTDLSCIILEDEFLPKYRGFETDDENEFKFSTKSAVKTPTDTEIELNGNAQIVEVFARNKEHAEAFVESSCKTNERVLPFELSSIQDSSEPEIRKIVDSGDQTNRIDVVFMGDGYTASEKENFFSDIKRLAQEMFEEVTFKSYLPLFNIWAIYVESQESGIGYDGAKDTPFQLFREKGQLRGILPGNAPFARQVCTLTGASGCDYPSIIGNDDFYGGLGGEFVISTKSHRTGTVVLRHEMGHNFVSVGEEYDNGQVYSGVNSVTTLDDVSWTSWLTSGKLREEKATYRLLHYPWADLDKSAQTFTFTSDGTFKRWYLLASVSAAAEEDCLEFTLDGEVLPWKTRGFDDREFYSWTDNKGFTAGTHTFSVRTKTSPTNPDIPRMICSVTLHEYGGDDEFVKDNTHISAYPTWDIWRIKTYRPTNAGCIMRNMTHDRFCSVCQEGMWTQFLQRISLIDRVDMGESNGDGTRVVTVRTLKLGQLREAGKIDGEKLQTKWFLNKVEQPQFKNLFSINASKGAWVVEVKFVTHEVRSDPKKLLISTESVIVP